jgi:hypothetical protein
VRGVTIALDGDKKMRRALQIAQGMDPSPIRGQVLADSLLMMSNRTYRTVYATPFPNVQEEREWVGRVMKERTEISKACDIQKFFMP